MPLDRAQPHPLFEIDDVRSLAEVAVFLRGQGYEPVWKDWDATYDGRFVF